MNSNHVEGCTNARCQGECKPARSAHSTAQAQSAQSATRLAHPVYLSQEVYSALCERARSWGGAQRGSIHAWVDREIRRLLSLSPASGYLTRSHASSRPRPARSVDNSRAEPSLLAHTQHVCPFCLRKMTIDSKGRWPRHVVKRTEHSAGRHGLCPLSLCYVAHLPGVTSCE